MRTILRGLLIGALFSLLPQGGTAQLLPQQLLHESDPAPQLVERGFRHDHHLDFQCLECHDMRLSHGALAVRNPSECQACHHTGERLDLGCVACHDRSTLGGLTFPIGQDFALTVVEEPFARTVSFDHGPHEERDCEECHVQGPSFAIAELDCQSCHEEHHEPTVSQCASCHVMPDDESVHPLDVHLSCTGSGCHVDSPFAESPQTRTGCVWCHEEQRDHEPEGNCVDCHLSGGGDGP